LMVGFTVLTVVVCVVDTFTVDNVVCESLTLACCVLVLPFLLGSLRKFILGRGPSPSSVRRTAKSGKIPNGSRFGDGRCDVSDVSSTSAGTGQETIIESQRSVGMMQFIHAIDTAGKAADPHKAERLIAEMQGAGFQLSDLVYNSVIQACAQQGYVSRADKWLRQMRADGFEPNAATYNILEDTCAKKNDVVSAERCFIKKSADGIDPHVPLVDACAIFKAMKVKKGEPWRHKLFPAGLAPKGGSYSAMIDECAKVGDTFRAEQWHKEMVDSGAPPNAHNYGVLINAFVKKGNVVAAEMWLGRMEDAGVEINVDVYSSVIAACGMFGDEDRAIRAFHQMQRNGIRPCADAYSSLAQPFACRGDWQKVELLLSEMTTAGIGMDNSFLCVLLFAYGNAKPQERERAETATRSSVAAGVQMNDRLGLALFCVFGSSGARALRGELAGLIPPSRAPGLMPPSGAPGEKGFASCAMVNDGDGTMRSLCQLNQNARRTKIASYSKRVRPFADRGDWATVELLLSEMNTSGFAMNGHFLFALLHAYGNAKPQQRERAETATRNALAVGVWVNDHLAVVLSHVLGPSAAEALLSELSTGLLLPSGAPELMTPSGAPASGDDLHSSDISQNFKATSPADKESMPRRKRVHKWAPRRFRAHRELASTPPVEQGEQQGEQQHLPPSGTPLSMLRAEAPGFIPLSEAPGLMPPTGPPGLMLPPGLPFGAPGQFCCCSYPLRPNHRFCPGCARKV